MMIMPETPTELELGPFSAQQSQIELEVQSQAELPESSSELRQRSRSDEDEAPQTTQRRRLFLILVLSFCLCAIGLIYAFHHFHTTGPVRSCESEACLQVSAHLSAFADPFRQPCDFYLFTCLSDWRMGRHRGPGPPTPSGAPQDQSPSPQHVDQQLRKKKLTDRKTLLLQYLRDTLDSNDRLTSSAEQKAKMFYHSCLDTRSIETAGAEPFLTLIQNLGGWAVSGQKWNQTDFNSTLGLLMKKYRTFPFFNLLVGKDPNESTQQTSRNYIQIDQPDLLIPIEFNNISEKSQVNTKTVRQFLSVCQRYLSLLGAPQIDIMNHVGLFISLSSELAVAASPLQYRLAKGLLYQRMTIRELQTQAPMISWLGCLQRAFEPVSLTEEDPVLVHNLPYIIKMSQIISNWLNKPDYSDRGPLQTFMVFNLLHTMMPALDARFTEKMEQKEPRWKTCLLETERGFGSVLTHFLNKRTGHAEVNEISENTVTSLKSKLHGLQWNKTLEAVMKKVHSLTPRMWTSSQTNEAELDQFLSETIVGTNFFWNYVQLLSLWQKRSTKLLEEQSDGVDILSVSPVLSGNELVFPLGMFVPPLFHPTYPRAINYGVTGFLIAKDILHLLLPDFHVHSKSVPQVADCVWTYYLSVTNGSGAGGTSLSSAQQQEVWVQYSALEVALQAYQQSLKSNPSDTSLSGLSHTELFLSAFAQINCDSDPHHDSMPLEPSFLVKVLCAKSELCDLRCAKEKRQHASC